MSKAGLNTFVPVQGLGKSLWHHDSQIWDRRLGLSFVGCWEVNDKFLEYGTRAYYRRKNRTGTRASFNCTLQKTYSIPSRCAA